MSMSLLFSAVIKSEKTVGHLPRKISKHVNDAKHV